MQMIYLDDKNKQNDSQQKNTNNKMIIIVGFF